jgi:hypothetical protein
MMIQSITIYRLPITNYHRTFGISTLVERTLQIHLFMQNKPNFRKSQMNLTDLLTREYEKKDTWWSGKNKANSNPIQSQFKPNTKPIQSQTNPILVRHAVWQGLPAISLAGQRQKNAVAFDDERPALVMDSCLTRNGSYLTG